MERNWVLINGWVERKCHIEMKYYLGIKKVEILPFASTSIDLEGIMLKWNKSDRESQILLWFHSYVEHKKQKRKQNKWTNQTKPKQTHREQCSDYQKERDGVEEGKMDKGDQLYGNKMSKGNQLISFQIKTKSLVCTLLCITKQIITLYIWHFYNIMS